MVFHNFQFVFLTMPEKPGAAESIVLPCHPDMVNSFARYQFFHQPRVAVFRHTWHVITLYALDIRAKQQFLNPSI